MSEPKEDPIEELLTHIEWTERHPEIVMTATLVHARRAAPAIRALQERIKLNESLTVTGLITRLGEAEAKLALVIEAGEDLNLHARVSDSKQIAELCEAWRKAVEE